MANTTVNPLSPSRSNLRVAYPAGQSDVPQLVTNAGEAMEANGIMTELAMVALGQTWQCSIATGSAYTHVITWPTTRAEIVFFNGYAAGSNIVMAIRSVWYANVATSVGAATNVALLAQVVPTSATALTNDTAQLITSRSGKGTYGGLVTRAVANTAYAVASKWEVIGTAQASATASMGLACFAQVNGSILVPPQAFLCLNTVLGTATGTGRARDCKPTSTSNLTLGTSSTSGSSR